MAQEVQEHTTDQTAAVSAGEFEELDELDPALLSVMLAALSEHPDARLLPQKAQVLLCQRAVASGQFNNEAWLADAITALREPEPPAAKTFVELSIPKKREIGSFEDFTAVMHLHKQWLDSVLNPSAVIVGGRANLEGQHLKGFDLGGFDLRGARFSSAVLEDIDFSGANLATADLSKVKFIRCNLRGAKLKKADLSYATFQASEVAQADFRDAIMTGVRGLGSTDDGTLH